jgi:hypothetical protein
LQVPGNREVPKRDSFNIYRTPSGQGSILHNSTSAIFGKIIILKFWTRFHPWNTIYAYKFIWASCTIIFDCKVF